MLLAFIAIQTSLVQNWLVGIATNKLSKELGTEVKIDNVNISFFNRLNLEGVLIKDLKKDTILYAGKFKLRITDWFFFKDTVVCKYLGLEDAVIKLKRKDSTWNYQFIESYFGSSPTPQKNTNKKSINLDLKKIDLKNFYLLQDDQWIGQTMQVKLASLLLDADRIDIDKKNFLVNNIKIVKPVFSLRDFDGLRPDSLKPKPTKQTGYYFNPSNIALLVKEVIIVNGGFNDDTNNDLPIKGFDGSHIAFGRLNARFENFKFNKDTITALIDLNALDRSGFQVKKLKSKFRLTPRIMEFANLDLVTNRSRLTNYYAMRFKDFNEDMKDYLNKVTMDANFVNSRVHSSDIGFFALDVKEWNRQIDLTGKFYGTVSDFSITNLSARTNNSNISGNLKLKGLPNIDRTTIQYNNGTIITSHADITAIIPSLRKVTEPNLAALGKIIFRGNFNGSVHAFKSNGIFSTALGGINTNLTMTIPIKGDATYKGTLTTSSFNLGKFLNTTDIGIIDFNGMLDGSSFNLNRLRTSIEGNFNILEFNGYAYKNITTKGIFQNKFFEGELKVDDKNFDFTSSVVIDLNKAEPSFNIVGDLVKSNLKELQFTKEQISLSGLLDVNFTGKDIDAFLGSAKFLDANLLYNNEKISFDSLIIHAALENAQRKLSVGSNEFKLEVVGKEYKILDLPNAFQTYLHAYYPSYINKPAKIPQNQDFSVTLTTRDFEKYAKLINPKLNGLSYVTLAGTVNTNDTVGFTIMGDIPSFKYDKYQAYNLHIDGKGTREKLNLFSNIAEIRVGDSIRFPNTNITVLSKEDRSDVQIKTSANNTLNEANLYAQVYTLEDGFRLYFNPSEFVLNDKKWQIQKNGELVVRKNFIDAKNVRFTQGFQEIFLETEEEDGGNTNNLKVNLQNVVLGDLTQLFFKDPRLEGQTSGKVILSNFYGDFKADASLKADQFRFNDDSVGIVNIKADYDAKTGVANWDITSPNELYDFASKGSYKTKDSINPLSLEVNLVKSNINVLEPFLTGLFSDLKGVANGKLKITGSPSSPQLIGTVNLRKAGLLVDYSKVYYTIDSATLKFEEDGINFGRFTIKDKFNNIGNVRGKLYEKNFKNMVFDFDVNADKLLLIDTKASDNEQFYGNAIGKASFSLKGPETGAKMTIVAEATDSSHITIPDSDSKESGDADFIVFKKYGIEMEDVKEKSNFNLLVDLDITANNKVDIDVVLDDLTGDVIKANGNGRLKIKAGTTEPLSIRGRYNIEKGGYNFNFQSFIKKPFTLLPEAGNYIEWTGDPFNAEIKIDAQYTAERISVSDLIGNQDFRSDVKAYRGDVYVIAELRDKLTKPSIKFRLDFPTYSPIKTDNSFSQFIKRIESDNNEILKQVSYLIVFGSFAPQGGNNNSNNNVLANTGVNTITNLITKEINKQVSNLLFKITGDKSWSFDIGTSVYSSSNLLNNGSVQANTLDRTRVNFKIGKSFLNDKVIITFGNDFDFNVGSSTAISNGQFQWLPDFNMEFVLSRDRKLRAIVFSKNGLGVAGNSFGRTNRQGLSISYRKDFEKLFGTKEDEIEFKPPADSTKPITRSGSLR